ncbi:MAG: STAS domain-containing protein [Synergistaceae bacterium]|nr:STAS domain-containing protein [Synergistaceae bacterium]
MSLVIKKSVEGTSLTLTLTGRLDTVTSKEFDSEFEAAASGINNVILDFAGLEYISSAGLRSLLKAKRAISDGSIKIIHANNVVKDVFAMSHFSDHIPLEND